MRFALLSVACGSLLLPSCGVVRAVGRGLDRLGSARASQDAPKKAPSDERMEVGDVAFVRDAAKPFVLVRVRGKTGLPEKAALEARGIDGQTSHLKMSGEKRGAYFVADILDGRPKLGDTVSLPYPKTPRPGSALFAQESAKPEATESADVAAPAPSNLRDSLDQLPSVPTAQADGDSPVDNATVPTAAPTPVNPARPPKLPGQSDEPFVQRVE